MKAVVTTTITTLLDIETFETDHSVAVSCVTEGIPQELVLAAAIGATKSARRALENALGPKTTNPPITDAEY